MWCPSAKVRRKVVPRPANKKKKQLLHTISSLYVRVAELARKIDEKKKKIGRGEKRAIDIDHYRRR